MGNEDSRPNNRDTRNFFEKFLNREPQPQNGQNQPTQNQQEEEDWDAFMDRNNTVRDQIYTGVNNELKEYDPTKHAEKVKIQEQVLHKTKMHFFIRAEDLRARVRQDPGETRNLELWVDIDVSAEEGFDFSKFPSGGLVKVYLFSRQKKKKEDNTFCGFEEGLFYKSFVSYNFEKKVDQTKVDIKPGGKQTLKFKIL